MGVIDVGSEGDKKKRLNRQSANYGSKAVACVHCRARKTRCDAARPACGNCARRSLVCSYIHTQPSQPRSKGKKAAAAAAKEEAARLAAKSSGDADGTPSISTSASPTRRHSPSGSQHSAHAQDPAHLEWQHHGHHNNPPHGHVAHVSHSNPYSRSHPLSLSRSPHPPPGTPIRVDDRLIEESAERDRPLTRSPAVPPIATLPASGSSSSPTSPTSASPHSNKHDAPYLNGTANGKGMYANGRRSDGKACREVEMPVGEMHSHPHSHSRSNSADMRGTKRKTPGSDEDVEHDLGRDSDERPDRKRKWQAEGERESVSGDEKRMRI